MEHAANTGKIIALLDARVRSARELASQARHFAVQAAQAGDAARAAEHAAAAREWSARHDALCGFRDELQEG